LKRIGSGDDQPPIGCHVAESLDRGDLHDGVNCDVIWLDTLLYELIGKLMGLGLRACEQYMGQTSTVGLSRNYKDVRPWDKFAQAGAEQ
jgi:hypothetical protein